MICDRKLFDYLPDDPGMMLEQAPMAKLTADSQLGAFTHDGFWQPMDTFQEFNLLNRLWDTARLRGRCGRMAMAFADTYWGKRVLSLVTLDLKALG